MMRFFKLYALAFHLLTVFRIGSTREHTLKDQAAALPFFPLVGLFLGAVMSMFHSMFQFLLPEEILDFLVVMGLALLSGACHVAGFSAWVDAAPLRAEGSTGEGIGTGSVSLFALLLMVFMQWAKFDLLTLMPHTVKPQAIILLPMMSHWAIVLGWGFSRRTAIVFDTDDPPHGPGWLEQFLAGGFSLGILGLFLKLNTLPPVLIMGAFLFMLSRNLRSSPEPVRAPALGAYHELGGIVFLFSLLWAPFFQGTVFS